MTNKFKIGDIVKIIKKCEKYDWYHTNHMKIIAFNKYYYFTDYWEGDLLKKHGIEYFNDEYHNGITEECLEFDKSHYRKQKLESIFKKIK